MARTFVVINDPVHGMLRRLTRHTPLRVTVGTDGSLDLQNSIEPDLLQDSYFHLALLHRLYRGLREPVQTQHRTALQSDKNNVVARAGYFDAIRLDRRCCRDLRLKVSSCGPGL